MNLPDSDPDKNDLIKDVSILTPMGARLALDENFNNNVLRGIVRRRPSLDILRIQDAGLTGKDDPEVLAWAAGEGRVLVSHDVSTLTRFAYERLNAGLPMPGLIEVGPEVPLSVAIDDLLLIAECSVPDE